MKKFLGAVICLFVLNACDDGDLTFDTFDFSTVQAAKCGNNNLVYKVNGNEALVIQINGMTENDAFPFKNVVGTRIIPLNEQNKIFYRTFSDNVTGSTYFCSTIPPVSPTVTSEYISSTTGSGTIEIKTTLNPGGTTLANSNYNHLITFRNVTFINAAGGTIVYDELIFGNFATETPIDFAVSTLPVRICTGTDGKFFKIIDSNIANVAGQENLSKVLEINIPISELPTQTGNPKRVFFNETNGISAVYRIYNGDLTNEDYCNQATSLVKYEEWKTNEGIDAVEDIDDRGFFEITSSLVNGQVVYSVTIRRSSFTRAFPVDDTGAAAATFTNSTDINFGQISLP